ncbi:MAG: phospholipase D-like domain-containing protein [bacterium]
MACLIDENAFHKELASELSHAEKSITILSAFITLSGIRWLKNNLPSKDILVTIVARWQLNDLLSGASDHKAYPFCKENGWNFRIDTRLHSKVYCIDDSVLFVGSANLTARGLSIGKQGNYELTTKAYATHDDKKKIIDYISSCFAMKNIVYKEMLALIDEHKNNSSTEALAEWPESIIGKILPQVEYLWVEDLLFLRPEQLLGEINSSLAASFSHDMEVLNIAKDNLSKNILKENFIRSRPYAWLINQFKSQQAMSLQFGKVSALLHNSLLDDPRPYRKAVKEFVAVIFEWVAYLNLKNLYIVKHRHSQSILYKS